MSEEVPAWSRDDAAAAYVDAMRGVLTVAQDLDHDEWHRPTDLPGWAVFDVVAHVAATEDELAGRSVPSPLHDWSLFPHVSSPFQQYTEVGVEARRHLTPAELIDELAGLVDERGRQLAHAPEDAHAEMRGPA
ncbi:MAG: maleylpyruvate isomerase N-terminal domain-containing protein, partial [Actinomycetes bacterium]